jgi:hypothetical protein
VDSEAATSIEVANSYTIEARSPMRIIGELACSGSEQGEKIQVRLEARLEYRLEQFGSTDFGHMCQTAG